MKEKRLSNALFVMLGLEQGVPWINMWEQFTKEKTFQVHICDDNDSLVKQAVRNKHQNVDTYFGNLTKSEDPLKGGCANFPKKKSAPPS